MPTFDNSKKRVESTLIIKDKFCLVVTPISEPNSTFSPITTLMKINKQIPTKKKKKKKKRQIRTIRPEDYSK